MYRHHTPWLWKSNVWYCMTINRHSYCINVKYVLWRNCGQRLFVLEIMTILNIRQQLMGSLTHVYSNTTLLGLV